MGAPCCAGHNTLCVAAQVLRVIPREEPAALRDEVPSALRRPAKAAPPAVDAAGLARHLAVAELQVSAPWCLSGSLDQWHHSTQDAQP